MQLEALGERRVAIWGYGREGRAVHRALRKQFPRLHLVIFAPGQDGSEHELVSDAYLTLYPREPENADLHAIDVLIKSPGVSAYAKQIIAARELGIEVTSGVALWFAGNPQARTLVITGSKGKSTTAAVCAHMLRRCGLRVALAGNIGVPLMDMYRLPSPPDWWVIELSSFQTLDMVRAPDIAVVLNLYPEHLDWHGNLDRYFGDKLALLRAPGKGVRLINAADEELVRRTADITEVSRFNEPAGWQPHAGGLARAGVLRVPADAIGISGAHNRINLCAALAAVEACGVDINQAGAALGSFHGLPHRLQRLGWRDGLLWINDSISTVPEASLAALASLENQPAVLLAGGYDRGIAWNRFAAALIPEQLRAVVVLGQNRERITAALSACPWLTVRRADELGEAVTLARRLAQPGDAVLLSPGAPSFPDFRDYTERGRSFAESAGFAGAASMAIEGLGV